jgi:hypothetical protein
MLLKQATKNVFSSFAHSLTDEEALGRWQEYQAFKEKGRRPFEFGFEALTFGNNTLMQRFKKEMAEAVFTKIDRLVITSQNTPAQDNEDTYTGALYTTSTADEFSRSVDGNPYSVAWNIPAGSATGAWGSYVLITSGGLMINRALAGISKGANASVIVEFTGSVV